MPKTLKQINDQISKLQKQADAVRAKEVAGVVARIREAIEHYDLSASDLFGGKANGSAPARKAMGRKLAGRKARGPSAPKYQDGAGNTWTGVGKRPNWFKAAIEGGKTAADLEITA